tara:strand:- start:2645 stop:2929 length:285 start_codon:yes stop_codon:yes gene_type:complete
MELSNLDILDHSFDGMDMIVTVSKNENTEDYTDIYLESFVPEDYNVLERIDGGYDSPNYIEYTDEDYTSDDWYNSKTSHEQKALVMDAIKSKLN